MSFFCTRKGSPVRENMSPSPLASTTAFALTAALAFKDDTVYPVSGHDYLGCGAVIEHLDSVLIHHQVHHILGGLGIYRRVLGIEGHAQVKEPAAYLVGEAVHALCPAPVFVKTVSGKDRCNNSACPQASKACVSFKQHHGYAATGSAHRSSHACRPSTNNEHIHRANDRNLPGGFIYPTLTGHVRSLSLDGTRLRNATKTKKGQCSGADGGIFQKLSSVHYYLLYLTDK